MSLFNKNPFEASASPEAPKDKTKKKPHTGKKESSRVSIRERIKDGSSTAIGVLEDLLNADDDAIRKDAAKVLLTLSKESNDPLSDLDRMKDEDLFALADKALVVINEYRANKSS